MKRTGSLLRRAFWDGLFYENIVLVQAVGVCPILGAATTLRAGVGLSACMAATMLLSALFALLCGRRLPAWLRPAVYTVVAALCLTGAAALQDAISTELYAALYRFLPLLAVNAVFFSRDGFSEPMRRGMQFVKTLGTVLGFGAVTCLLSALREWLSTGTLWGVSMPWGVRVPAMSLPFAALLLLGMMAAAVRALRQRHPRRLDEADEAADTNGRNIGSVAPEEVTFGG